MYGLKQPRLFQLFHHTSRSRLSTLRTSTEISDYLSKPSWSVRETLLAPSTSSSSDLSEEEITPAKLHHLLRLSALPIPSTKAEEEKAINDLKRQLQFVRAIQKVDTTGVEPLVAIRDETEEGRKEREIGMDDPEIKRAFAREKVVGRRGRIVSVRDDEETLEKEREKRDWDPLKRANRVVGRYIAVDTARD